MTVLTDILVHLDDTDHSDRRLEVALQLAGTFTAHLIGLRVTPWRLFFEAELVSGAMEALVQAEREAEEKAEQKFRDRGQQAGIMPEWRSMRGSFKDILTLNARYTDLVIMGQMLGARGTGRGTIDLPARVALEASKPVLVVPRAGALTSIGRRIMVAWNASRSATRAVNDALPLMQQANRVTVLAINPHRGVHAHGELPCADICTHLARQGVNVEAAQIVTGEKDTGDILLAEVADRACDLLVMGAYSHSRVRELIFGGVTCQVLRDMMIPSMISH